MIPGGRRSRRAVRGSSKVSSVASSARTRCAMRCVRSPRARATMTGSWFTTPRAPASRTRICNCSSASLPRIRWVGLLAVPLADTLKRALEPGAHVTHVDATHRSRWPVARRDSAGVPLRCAAARARSGARCESHAHRRSAGHRMERPAAADWSPAGRITSRSRRPTTWRSPPPYSARASRRS